MVSTKLWDEDNDHNLELALKNLVEAGLSSTGFGIEPKIQELFDKLVETLRGQDGQTRVSYYIISKTVFMLEDTDGMDVFIPTFKSLVETYVSESDNEILNKKLIKIVSHIELSNMQKESLYKSQMQSIHELSDGYSKLNTSYAEVMSKLRYESVRIEDRFNSKVDTMYNSFISVLGIFIAISFSLFGAATLLKNIFTISTGNGFDVSAPVIGANISLAGFATILIYLLIVGLIQGISTITNKHYFFSIRKLFVVVSVAGGVILSGFIYGHSKVSWNHFWLLVGFLVLYAILCLVIFGLGSTIKQWLINWTIQIRRFKNRKNTR